MPDPLPPAFAEKTTREPNGLAHETGCEVIVALVLSVATLLVMLPDVFVMTTENEPSNVANFTVSVGVVEPTEEPLSVSGVVPEYHWYDSGKSPEASTENTAEVL